MNERIKYLAIDCAGQMEWDAPKNPESFTFNRDELQKFAELIIKECLKQVRDEVQYLADWDKADQVVSAVKKHFGVKE